MSNTTQKDSRLTRPNAIVVALYKPKPEQDGVFSYDRPATFSEFVDQVTACLTALEISGSFGTMNAYDAAESVFNYFARSMRGAEGNGPEYLDTLLKDATGRIFALAGPGNNEGDVVRLVYLKDDGNYVALMHFKYLIGPDYAWQVARHLTEALERGRYLS